RLRHVALTSCNDRTDIGPLEAVDQGFLRHLVRYMHIDGRAAGSRNARHSATPERDGWSRRLEDHAALDVVAELANVSRPFVLRELGDHLGGEERLAGRGVELLEKGVNQVWDVFGSLA